MYSVIPHKGTVCGLTYDLNDPWNDTNDLHLGAKGGEECLILPEMDADLSDLPVLTQIIIEFHSILQEQDWRSKITAGFYPLRKCPRCGEVPEFRFGHATEFGFPHPTYRIVCSRCNFNSDDIHNSSPERAIIGWEYRISRVSP